MHIVEESISITYCTRKIKEHSTELKMRNSLDGGSTMNNFLLSEIHCIRLQMEDYFRSRLDAFRFANLVEPLAFKKII